MSYGIFNVPKAQNEVIKNYAPQSQERLELKETLSRMKSQTIEIPAIIGGKEVRTGNMAQCVCPHDHKTVLAHFHQCEEAQVEQAVQAALAAKKEWANLPWEERAAVFLKAADLLATKYRSLLNAATMLGQSKNAYQAEIDSACELIDFWRFNVQFMSEIYHDQPLSSPGMWNRMEHRPLEGFVFAVTPFNFTAIAGNLPTAPALMGNVVLWKPASTAVYSAHFIMKILEEAGLPPGVINMIPGSGRKVGDPAIKNPNLAGIHFTGSTGVFNSMWKTIGENMSQYKSYPRLVGETGGKDFIFAHPSADPQTLVTAMVRGAFEYQGQKCSAASRAYIPRSVWNKIKDPLVETTRQIAMGDILDFRNFMGAVIDREAYKTIKKYIDYAKDSKDAEILSGGECDDSVGYFIRPTLILAKEPMFKTMEEEIFGPVLTIFVYEDADFEKTLQLCDKTSPYALTGAIFAKDRRDIQMMTRALENAAGNFYVNDKPTGAVVGQQPFGGARTSGTNDKAGSKLNLLRWVSQRTIKENFIAPTNIEYPHMKEA